MQRSSNEADGRGVATAGRATLIAFVFMALLGGGNPVAIRVSNLGLPPFWGAELRIASAALVFWLIVAVRRIAVPRGRALVGAIVYGLVSVGAAYSFAYWGLQRVPAGLGGAILALVPLMTFFFAWAHGLEVYRWQGLVGALIATAGVVVGVVGGFGGAVHVPSVLALVAGTACFGEAAVVFKLFPPIHPVSGNAVALSTGAPILLLMSLVAGERWSLPTTTNTWLAFAYLALVGSVVVFSLYLFILSRWTASATSYSFLLMPLATVAIAAWLLGEAVTVSFGIGVALVLAGVWLGAIRGAPRAVQYTCSEMPNKAMC